MLCVFSVVMVVFDLTDEVSLANASRWMESATENAVNPVRFLVGTKRDLLVRNILEMCACFYRRDYLDTTE